MKLVKTRSVAILSLLAGASLFVACSGDETPPGGGMTTGSGGATTTTGGFASGGAGVTGSGGAQPAGSGGMENIGGGGMGGETSALDPVDCVGCAVFGLTFEEFGTGTDFEKQYSAPIDMTNTVVTFTLTVAMEGNAGGIQAFAKTGDLDGDANDYKSVYTGWQNLSDSTAETTITLDLSAQAADVDGFLKNSVTYIGLNVAAGDTWDGAELGEVAVYVDSVTFSDAATPDLTFDAGVEGFVVNTFNSPIEGSTVSHQ